MSTAPAHPSQGFIATLLAELVRPLARVSDDAIRQLSLEMADDPQPTDWLAEDETEAPAHADTKPPRRSQAEIAAATLAQAAAQPNTPDRTPIHAPIRFAPTNATTLVPDAVAPQGQRIKSATAAPTATLQRSAISSVTPNAATAAIAPAGSIPVSVPPTAPPFDTGSPDEVSQLGLRTASSHDAPSTAAHAMSVPTGVTALVPSVMESVEMAPQGQRLQPATAAPTEAQQRSAISSVTPNAATAAIAPAGSIPVSVPPTAPPSDTGSPAEVSQLGLRTASGHVAAGVALEPTKAGTPATAGFPATLAVAPSTAIDVAARTTLTVPTASVAPPPTASATPSHGRPQPTAQGFISLQAPRSVAAVSDTEPPAATSQAGSESDRGADTANAIDGDLAATPQALHAVTARLDRALAPVFDRALDSTQAVDAAAFTDQPGDTAPLTQVNNTFNVKVALGDGTGAMDRRQIEAALGDWLHAAARRQGLLP